MCVICNEQMESFTCFQMLVKKLLVCDRPRENRPSLLSRTVLIDILNLI